MAFATSGIPSLVAFVVSLLSAKSANAAGAKPRPGLGKQRVRREPLVRIKASVDFLRYSLNVSFARGS